MNFDEITDEDILMDLSDQDDDVVLELDEDDMGTGEDSAVFELEPGEKLEAVLPRLDTELDGDAVEAVHIPGTDIVLEQDGQVEQRSWERDGDHSLFLPYLREKRRAMPRHNGTTVGCERTIAYLRRLDREISRAISSDEDNVIDEAETEAIRDEIFRDIETLEEAIEKLNDKRRSKKAALTIDSKIYSRIGPTGDPMYYIKTASASGESMLQLELVEPTEQNVTAYMEWESGKIRKEAMASKIMLMVDPFLNEISSMIIRAHVTHGRNIEDVYRKLASKYNFSARDHLALHGLLRDKGLLLDKDFSRIDDEVEIGDDGIFAKIYPA